MNDCTVYILHISYLEAPPQLIQFASDNTLKKHAKYYKIEAKNTNSFGNKIRINVPKYLSYVWFEPKRALPKFWLTEMLFVCP